MEITSEGLRAPRGPSARGLPGAHAGGAEVLVEVSLARAAFFGRWESRCGVAGG